MTTTTYATISTNSGLVMWAGKAETPERACALTDAAAGDNRGEYVQITRPEEGCYAVHELPDDFDAAEDVDAILAAGRLVGWWYPAIAPGDDVETGAPGTYEHERGTVHSVHDGVATVGWESGVTTEIDLDQLRLA